MNARFILATGKAVAFLLSFQLLSILSPAQVRYTGNNIDLIVSGTSTLHDWTMKSAKADCSAAFDFNGAGVISGLQTLSFSTPVNSLKSDHTAMDKNAYKALKTEKNPAISYTLTGVSVSPAATGSTVKCTGKLTIAGATRDEEIVALCKPNADNTITVTGSRKISMKEFSIDPPSFMLGTVKTGNDIVISFTLQLKRS